MLKLDIKKPAFEALVELQSKQFKQVMLSIIKLTKDPYPHDSQKLNGYPYHRIDIGEFRIIYDVDVEETVRIILVGKRNLMSEALFINSPPWRGGGVSRRGGSSEL